MDRSHIARCLAKALAYKQCGKDHQARIWAAKLVQALECADIIVPEWDALAHREAA